MICLRNKRLGSFGSPTGSLCVLPNKKKNKGHYSM
ncbi:hypothetical protein pEaSNUABM29_00086 [Erwinia phage pEa_SNUABM_29]|nr:hypothetical protein pEaSNUABM29_00086 [Erwinia phage pEa_SNUABM_29]